MSDLLAISTDGLSSPSIELKIPDNQQGTHPYGWGFSWYPNDHQAALVMKDPLARNTNILMDTMSDWSTFRSTVFLGKVRGAAKGYTHHETQPFSRSFAGKDWLFMHKGNLDKDALAALQTNKSRFLEPVGKTDSELAFCLFLNWLFETRSTFAAADVPDQKARKLSDCPPELILSWFSQFDPLGEADMMITDGISLVCFHGRGSANTMYYTRTRPPSDALRFDSDVAALSFPDPRDTYRTALIVSTIPFAQGEWTAMQPGQMIIVRRGMLVWDSQPDNQTKGFLTPPPSPVPQFQTPTLLGHESILNVRAITKTKEGKPLSYRVYDLKHTTTYRYEEPVQHSTHVFRLHPVEDSFQELVTAKFIANMDGEEIRYEDVFGNASLYYSINKPYSTLTIESQSQVKIYASPPDDHTLSRRQTQIPLVWMPWQRQMMMPYLLPQELPETQLDELTAYAMSFVERNDGNLMHVLKDINLSIYRDYKYVQGTTSLSTTPFDVYTTRKGVCQDFANLFICLARLLSIPARYRMGYIYTGVNYQNTIQSEASHAWAEVYLPYVGWRGFDPTNGCMAGQDHIRVACGRNYLDATPTSGTIFKGGGKETLTVSVKIEDASL